MDTEKILSAVKNLDISRLADIHLEITEETEGESGVVLVIGDLTPEQQIAICEDFCSDPIIATIQIQKWWTIEDIKKVAKHLMETQCHIVFSENLNYLLLLLVHWRKNLVGVLHFEYGKWCCLTY